MLMNLPQKKTIVNKRRKNGCIHVSTKQYQLRAAKVTGFQMLRTYRLTPTIVAHVPNTSPQLTEEDTHTVAKVSFQ